MEKLKDYYKNLKSINYLLLILWENQMINMRNLNLLIIYQLISWEKPKD